MWLSIGEYVKPAKHDRKNSVQNRRKNPAK